MDKEQAIEKEDEKIQPMYVYSATKNKYIRPKPIYVYSVKEDRYIQVRISGTEKF